MVKNLPAMQGAAGDLGLIPECGGSPGEGHGNPISLHEFLNNERERRISGSRDLM